jgi:short-subunit dehydrogenase
MGRMNCGIMVGRRHISRFGEYSDAFDACPSFMPDGRMIGFDGKTVILTGAAGGIGMQIAARLRQAGARLIGIDRIQASKCDETIIGDLTCEDGLSTLGARLGGLECDVLINLAGRQYFGPFSKQSPSALWEDYVLNLIAPAMLARAVLPAMIARRTGRIVNVGSVLGAAPFGHFASFSASTAGLKGLSDALRRELADTGVAVTHIAPRAVTRALCSKKATEFASLVKMPMDNPSAVASRIAAAVIRGETDVIMGLPETLFAHLQALAPRFLDRLLAERNRRAAALFR